MAAITYDDLDPQDNDSVLTLKIKEILSIQASSAAILGQAGTVEAPQDTDSWAQLEAKYLASIREMQAALSA